MHSQFLKAHHMYRMWRNYWHARWDPSAGPLLASLPLWISSAARFICTSISIAVEVTICHLWTWRRKSKFHMNFVWIVNLRNQAKPIKSATSISSSFCLLSWGLYKHFRCIYLFHFLFKLKAVNMKEYFVLTFIGTNCITIITRNKGRTKSFS